MKEIRQILSDSTESGWVFEPDAKRLLSIAGIEVPAFKWTTDIHAALNAAKDIGYPVVAKIVSPEALHKSDVSGVVVDIDSDDRLQETYERFSQFPGFKGMLVEEMLSGIELIVGAKVDYQFGPVVLLGLGGTGVEIYRDTTLRMAPLKEADVDLMIHDLKAYELLEGYRGADPINLQELRQMLVRFSELIMELERSIDSADLNPVMCTKDRCVVADARIMLSKNP